jgi:hypothetical protein
VSDAMTGIEPGTAVAPLKPLPVELRVLAERINARTRHTWYDNGRDFIQGKAQCEHGQWLAFLAVSGFGERPAQLQMQAARAIDAGEVPPDLTLQQTLVVIRKPESDSYLQDGLEDRLRASWAALKASFAEWGASIAETERHVAEMASEAAKHPADDSLHNRVAALKEKVAGERARYEADRSAVALDECSEGLIEK